MVGIIPVDTGVVIGYQVDEFTYTWSAECFIAWSHIYTSFMGKVSTLTHLPLELGCEDYSFFDQTVNNSEHGLDSILMDSVNTTELYASFHEANDLPSSVSPGFLCLVSAIFDNSRL